MKNIILSVLAFIALGTSAFAQDTIQSFQKLTIDSTLVVGDSANFHSKVVVDEEMTIFGKTEMISDATARNDLKVEGDLYLPYLSAPGENQLDILFSDPADGKTYRGGIGYLSDMLYSKQCAPDQGIIYNPTWSNGPNKIYVECPEVKVGIATANPTHNLTNLGDSKLLGHTWFGTTASIGADYDNFSKFYIRNQSYGAAIHINSSGNNGNFNKLLWLEYTNPTTEVIKVTNTTSNYNPFVLTASGNMVINNGTVNTFELASDGQLIIRNATQKNFQFDVTGLFRARRIRVDAENWADFVFEPNYQLMPLTEVKTYVQENKHLPGVPSEKEIVEGGIDIAEMNKILIQKVEELMLHMIDQNELTTQLKAEIEALKTKIALLEAVKN